MGLSGNEWLKRLPEQLVNRTSLLPLSRMSGDRFLPPVESAGTRSTRALCSSKFSRVAQETKLNRNGAFSERALRWEPHCTCRLCAPGKDHRASS